MKEYVLNQLQKEMKKKRNNIIPCIYPEMYCDSPRKRSCLGAYACMLDEEGCHDDIAFFFKKAKEKIDQISDKYAAIAIEMNCDYQYWTIRNIAGYAKQKGLITIGIHTLFGSSEYMRKLAQKDSNIDIIELIHKEDIEEYEQMLIDIKKNNKAIMIPYATKYSRNTDYYPFSTDYESTKKKMEQIKNGELKDLYDRQLTGYDVYWYPDREEPMEYLYQDRIQFVRANGSLQDVNERIQLEKENYNVGIIISTHLYSEIKL